MTDNEMIIACFRMVEKVLVTKGLGTISDH